MMLRFLPRLFGGNRLSSTPTWSDPHRVLTATVRIATPPRAPAAEEDLKWETWEPRPQPGDREWAICYEVPVRGTRHRRGPAVAYLKAFIEADRLGAPYAIDLEREPANPHDPNAIAVFGVLGPERHQIGYVPREIAADIAGKYPLEMPLRARLSRISVADGGRFAIFVNILRPAKRSAWWKTNMPPRR